MCTRRLLRTCAFQYKKQKGSFHKQCANALTKWGRCLVLARIAQIAYVGKRLCHGEAEIKVMSPLFDRLNWIQDLGWNIFRSVQIYFSNISEDIQKMPQSWSKTKRTRKEKETMTKQTITKTYPYNFDPLGFTGVYIIFLISAENVDCWYSLETPCWGGSNEYPKSMFWAEIWQILEYFYKYVTKSYVCQYPYFEAPT